MTDSDCTTPVPVSFRWHEDFLATVDAARGSVPRSTFVRDMVLAGLASRHDPRPAVVPAPDASRPVGSPAAAPRVQTKREMDMTRQDKLNADKERRR